MPLIGPHSPEFRVAQVGFGTLLEIQEEAEERGWATRWSSVDVLRRQVRERDVLLQTLMREEREGVVRAYRCLVLFSGAEGTVAGGVATIDVDPDRLEAMPRIDRDPDVRRALSRVFLLAAGGIAMVTKE